MSYIGKTPTSVPLTSSDITDGIISLPKLTDGTDGNLISYDASGNPVAVATGSDGQVLTSTGAGSPPAFEAVAANAGTLAMRAETTSNLTVAGTTQVEIVLQSAAVDIGSKYNNSNGRYTPGVAGRYFVSYAFSLAPSASFSAGETSYVKIRVNGGGAEIGQGGQGGMGSNGQLLLSGSGIAVIGDSDDYISIWMYMGNGNGGVLLNDQATWNVFRLD